MIVIIYQESPIAFLDLFYDNHASDENGDTDITINFKMVSV